MIILGYKTGYGSIIRALCAIGIGGVMICMPDRGIELIIKIIGAVVFAAGLVSLTVSIINRKDLKKNQFIFNLITACIVGGLGLTLIFFPGILTTTIIVVVGLGLIVFGCLQMLVLGSALNFLRLSYLPLAFGALAIIGGIVILFDPFPSRTMGIIAGALLVYYGVSELLSVSKISALRKEYEAGFVSREEPDREVIGHSGSDYSNIKDADYREVDDQ